MTLTVPGSLECLEIDPEASRATFSCGKLAGSGKSATVTKETNDLIVPGNPHPSLYYKETNDINCPGLLPPLII